jgi:hypothetical protein
MGGGGILLHLKQLFAACDIVARGCLLVPSKMVLVRQVELLFHCRLILHLPHELQHVPDKVSNDDISRESVLVVEL